MKNLILATLVCLFSCSAYAQQEVDVICSKIDRAVDEFTGEISWRSPRKISWGGYNLRIYKDKNGEKADYFLSLMTCGYSLSVGGVGVIVLFTDGTKMNRPNVNISIDIESSKYVYRAFLQLSDFEMKTLSEKTIKAYRLYVYDQNVKPGIADKFRRYASCIKESK